ncbi:unnamed protein product [Knipowitschia caucasica]
MATRNPEKNGQNSLPFAALKLLAPPVRLVSAALWKVMKERDVLQYGIVEEFVTSACDTVPGLLTLRHQAKLTLGFRARFILELCLKEPDPKTIAVHMKRIQVNVSPSSSVVNMKRDLKIQEAVENFHGLVQELLTDKTKRDTFYKEQFPVEFGPKYDQELEKLLWEFLIRLDTLLPVPNLAQTVSWLSEAPPVLEECARAATQPQLLKVLLQHQSCIGHLETAAALPPNMGDSILASLSLLPSGKQPSNEATEFGPTDESSHKTPFIKPVFGLISNDKVPCMISASQRLRSSEAIKDNDEYWESLSESNCKYTGVKEKQVGESSHQVDIGNGQKRKLVEDGDDESDQEDVLRKARAVKRRATTKSHQISDACKPKEIPVQNGEMLKTCLNKIGWNKPHIPDNDSLCAIWISCLKSQPKVKIEKLLLTAACDQENNLTKLRPIAKRSSVSTQTQRNNPRVCSTENKENTPNHPSSQGSSSQHKSVEQQNLTGENEDYVADSEDEGTKNFKGRLFAKRYCKTKHGTYVPTLREYWKPRAERRTLFVPHCKQR